MLSCKCLNFVANTDLKEKLADSSTSSSTSSSSVADTLRQTFLQKYPRNFIFYSQCIDFFKQAIGPVPDLTINAINQRDLIYSLTLDVSDAGQSLQSWQLSICSNCNVVLCAKRISGSPNSQKVPSMYLINCGILTNNEEISQKRSDKAFSDTFGILIMDHAKLEGSASGQNQVNNLTIGSLSTSFATGNIGNNLDSKQLRLRQLQSNLQQRLQREIAETDERIQRYTEQQFALLKSFREKSEQEYQMLVSLIQCIPEQQANEWLDRQPPILEVSNNGASLPYGSSRRRNTISSRRELSNAGPTTPTTTQPPSNIFQVNKEKYTSSAVTPTSPTSAINTTNNTRSTAAISTNANVTSSSSTSITTIAPTVVGGTSALNRKMSNFDTPPATPEATPMSVGNSPTFRQQQHITFGGQQTFQQQFPTIETGDDCLFELEGVDAAPSSNTSLVNSSLFLQNPPSPMRQQQNQNVPHQILPAYNSYQRNLSYSHQPPENHMSDLDESDCAEEAEDALDLDSSMPIAMTTTPQRRINSNNAAHMANFAKSLPIEIANSPMTSGRSFATIDSEDDELDNNVDIAASIKALAKSVHGEAVFGDLPRPRLRSQI